MKPKLYLSLILIALGVVWSARFPKTGQLDRPDFVISVAIGLGLVGSGAVLFARRRRTWPLTLLVLALLWSSLANVALFASVRDANRALQHETRAAATSRR